MPRNQFYILLIFVLLCATFMATAWEFWMEDILGSFFSDEFEPEATEERWEYVITIAIFVFLSLVPSFIVGKRLITKQDQLTNEIIKLSETDYLTDMYNRRKITEVLEQEITRCNRYGHALSIILIDIDFFKETNDQYGHIQGDQTLTEIADIIKTDARKSDYVGRWGGEEFLIICPETSIEGATTLAEKLRNIISQHPFTKIGQKTAIFGISSFNTDTSSESLVQRADIALYNAKSAGRNKVEQSI